ncbi:MAG: hypothetical protein D6768_03650, partial [Chloroflexi bacterium]
MTKIDSNDPGVDLENILTTLNEIGASILQLGVGKDLHTTLALIAQGAVRAVLSTDPDARPEVNASAVIWVYDAAKRRFDPD